MKPSLVVTLLLSAAVLLGLSLQAWQYLNQPFEPRRFASMVRRLGYLVPPPDDVVRIIKTRHLAVALNDVPYENGRDALVKAYLVDANRIGNAWWLPFEWRNYTKRSLHDSGSSYACEQLILVDGGLRNVEDVNGKPANFVGPALFHEWAHVVMLDFRFSANARRWIEVQIGNGDRLAARKDWNGARESFAKIVERCPPYYPAIDRLAAVEDLAGHPRAAVTLYRRSLLYKTDDSVAREQMMNILLRLKDYRTVLVEIERLRAGKESDPGLLYWRGVIQAKQRDFAQAIDSLNRAHDVYSVTGHPRTIDIDMLTLGLMRQGGASLPVAHLRMLRSDCRRVNPVPEELAPFCSMSDRQLQLSADKIVRNFMSDP